MIPVGDENPTLRTPVMTYFLGALTVAAWVFLQGAGFDAYRLAASVCDLGLVPAELTHGRPVGFAVPIGAGLACVVVEHLVEVLPPHLVTVRRALAQGAAEGEHVVSALVLGLEVGDDLLD